MRTLAAVAALFAALSTPALAAQFSIDPVGVTLDARTPSATITITNPSDERLRFQASGQTWTQTLGDDLVLTASDELVVFPTVFAVEPHSARRLRIGVSVKAPAAERAFRLVIEELPALESIVGPSKPGPSIAMRTRTTIPVFFAPASAGAPALSVAAAAVTRGTLSVDIANAGTAHATVTTIHAIAHDAAGKIVADANARGWYLLPGTTRRYALALPPASCGLIRSVTIDAVGPDARSSRTIETAPATCSP